MMKAEPMTVVLGADIGGTFTDLIWWDGQALRTAKLPTTPEAPERALLAEMDALGAQRPDVLLVHGSTVATNAFLERTGARVVFVTTAGFGDALEIGRQQRSAIYDIRAPRPTPLVPADRRVEVRERLDATGMSLIALENAEIARVADQVAALRPEAVAICLLHSYVDPAHERRLAETLSAVCPFVYASYVIDPAYREYERMSTTVINAYIAPRVATYVERLRGQLAGPLRLMGAHGGREPGDALERPANMILSGPAGGVVGASAVARAAGLRDVITLDMGGTSTDVALVLGGTPLLTRETLLEGLPLRAPMLDITTIGAGGGSLARFDRGGALRVGPQSAGAQPGPACYGRGGTQFTVTDAHLLLGHLLPEVFLGGRMALDVDAARSAALAALGDGAMSIEELAAGTLAVADAAMERAIRSVSARKGYDPADFWLLSFGGAGGLHAADLARALGMRGVLVPRLAGVLSALGMALADTQFALRESVLAPLATLDEPALEAQLTRMADACRARLLADDLSGDAHSLSLQVDRQVELRYVGQSYELTLPWQGESAAAAAFHAAHERRFGYADPTRAIEVVNAAVTARALNPGFSLPEVPSGPPAAPLRMIRAWFAGAPHPTSVYPFEALRQGQEIAGPAILAGEHATALVPPGATARVDQHGNARIVW
jgi:N-methylhydantoinase A